MLDLLVEIRIHLLLGTRVAQVPEWPTLMTLTKDRTCRPGCTALTTSRLQPHGHNEPLLILISCGHSEHGCACAIMFLCCAANPDHRTLRCSVKCRVRRRADAVRHVPVRH
eukprot:364277-Chlamydomonas_euryale.AAC.14